MSWRDRLWPLCEKLFWRRVGPLLAAGMAAWSVTCALHQGYRGWAIAYGVLGLFFFGLWVWGAVTK
jgi:hypothetical protein